MEWKNRFEAQDCVGERTGVAEWRPVLTVLKDRLCRSVEKMKLSGSRTARYASNAQYILAVLALFSLLFLCPLSPLPPHSGLLHSSSSSFSFFSWSLLGATTCPTFPSANPLPNLLLPGLPPSSVSRICGLSAGQVQGKAEK